VEEACVGTSVIPIFHYGQNSIEVEFLDNVTIAEDLRDKLYSSNNTNIAAVLSMARILQ
jgi:hypothetical protein